MPPIAIDALDRADAAQVEVQRRSHRAPRRRRRPARLGRHRQHHDGQLASASNTGAPDGERSGHERVGAGLPDAGCRRARRRSPRGCSPPRCCRRRRRRCGRRPPRPGGRRSMPPSTRSPCSGAADEAGRRSVILPFGLVGDPVAWLQQRADPLAATVALMDALAPVVVPDRGAQPGWPFDPAFGVTYGVASGRLGVVAGLHLTETVDGAAVRVGMSAPDSRSGRPAHPCPSWTPPSPSTAGVSGCGRSPGSRWNCCARRRPRRSRCSPRRRHRQPASPTSAPRWCRWSSTPWPPTATTPDRDLVKDAGAAVYELGDALGDHGGAVGNRQFTAGLITAFVSSPTKLVERIPALASAGLGHWRTPSTRRAPSSRRRYCRAAVRRFAFGAEGAIHLDIGSSDRARLRSTSAARSPSRARCRVPTRPRRRRAPAAHPHRASRSTRGRAGPRSTSVRWCSSDRASCAPASPTAPSRASSASASPSTTTAPGRSSSGGRSTAPPRARRRHPAAPGEASPTTDRARRAATGRRRGVGGVGHPRRRPRRRPHPDAVATPARVVFTGGGRRSTPRSSPTCSTPSRCSNG